MSTKTTFLIVLALSLVLFALGAIARPSMTDPIVTHWNAAGQPDGVSSVFTGVYLLPLIMLATALIVLFMPYLDPLQKNVALFRPGLNTFALVIAVFLSYIHLLTLAWNVGWSFNMNRWIVPGIALLLYFAGVLVGQAKRNYMVGIRTPWTLNNDQVWDDTHRLGAKAFKLSALIALLGLAFPDQAMYFILGPILLSALGVMVYSYFDFQRVTRSNQ